MKTLQLMIQTLQLAAKTDDRDERLLLLGEAAGVISIMHQAIVQGMTDEQVDALMPDERRQRLIDRMKAESEGGDVLRRLDHVKRKHGVGAANAVIEHASAIATLAGRGAVNLDDVNQAVEELFDATPTT